MIASRLNYPIYDHKSTRQLLEFTEGLLGRVYFHLIAGERLIGLIYHQK